MNTVIVMKDLMRIPLQMMECLVGVIIIGNADFEDRDRYHGRRHTNDPDNIARVKLDIPKFTGK
jgi:hypothetical protein